MAGAHVRRTVGASRPQRALAAFTPREDDVGHPRLLDCRDEVGAVANDHHFGVTAMKVGGEEKIRECPRVLGGNGGQECEDRAADLGEAAGVGIFGC